MPATQDLASVPPWISISVLVLAVVVPVLVAFAPRIADRRKRDEPDDPDEQPAIDQVDAAYGVLEGFIDDLQQQRDQWRSEARRTRKELDQARQREARQAVELALLRAQNEALRQQRSGPL